jgi:hypothetical protein
MIIIYFPQKIPLAGRQGRGKEHRLDSLKNEGGFWALLYGHKGRNTGERTDGLRTIPQSS